MRRWVLLVGITLALSLALAACGGDKDKQDDNQPATPETTIAPEGDATEEPSSDVLAQPVEPGLQVRGGLTVLRQSEGVRQNTGYFYAEVRNDSESTLAQVDAVLYLLDAGHYPVGEATANPLLTDIPPGQTFYVGTTFNPPEGYVDSKRWIWYSPTEEPSLHGYFDLPAAVTSQAVVGEGHYAVHGTAENTSGVTLAFPVIDVVLIGPDDNLVGLDHAVIKLSAPNGTWAPGEQADFEVIVGFIAVEPELVTGVLVKASGYAMP